MPLFVPDPEGFDAAELLEQLGAGIAARYEAAELVLLREIAIRTYKITMLEQAAEDARDALTRQRALRELATARATALRELRDVAQQEARRLRAEGLAEDVVATAAQHGEAAAAARLSLAKRLPARAGVVGSAAQAVGALTLDLSSKLEFLNARITRYPDDAYKHIISETAPRLILGAETKLLTQRAAVQRFLSEGIDAFQDRRGRTWRIGTYAEMATRTATQRAWQDAGVWRMQQSGVNLVTIQGGVDACKLCAPWIGKILSTNGVVGPVTMPHATQDRTVTVQVYGTLDQARRQGWGHPNCRDTVSAYLPGLPVPQAGFEYSPEAEAERAKQRKLERDIRDAKRREALASDDIQRRKAQREIRDAQAEMRDFLAETGRNRSRAREQLHFSDGSRAKPAPVRTQGDLVRKHGLNLGGDVLQPHEIEFYDRFLSAGNRVTYIPRHGWKPTNDFVWHDRGDVEIELKTLLTDDVTMRAIARPIRAAVKKANRGGVVKENFIADLRDAPLTDELVAEMRRYNVDNPHALIARLFAMSRGEVTEIDLE